MKEKMITIKEFSSFEQLGEERWRALHEQCPSATVFQSWEWLTAWWKTFNPGELWLVTAWRSDRLVGVMAGYVDNENTLKFVGEGHSDFGQILYENDRVEILAALVEYIFKTADKWRHAQFACVLNGTALASLLERKGAWVSAAMPCPRVLFDAKPAQSLLAKSSLKRHAKKLSALGSVRVEHFTSSETILPFMDEFFTQHQERWAITRTPSLFTDAKNKQFYRTLAELARQEGAVIFTRISLNEKSVAMHFGFKSQKQLIWYKPTYDPRLAATGPGEVLIAELLKKCVADELIGLDFTRGDEPFKLRFSSEIREVKTFEIASKFWLKKIEASKNRLRTMLVSAIDKLHLHKGIAALLHNLKATVRVVRSSGVSAAWKAAKERLAKHGPKHVDVFIRTACDQETTDNRMTVQALSTLDSLLATFDLGNPEHLEVLSDATIYLTAGARLWIAKCAQNIVSCGWELRGTGVDVTEINARLHFPHSVVCLMEFRTFSQHQKKGYYATLLRNISASEGVDHHLIYALSNNIASVKAIKKAGFTYAGRVTRSYLGALRFTQIGSEPSLSATSLAGNHKQ